MSELDIIYFLAMPDAALADLYSRWSEENYCAGWISDGEEEFVRWLLSGSRSRLFLSLKERSIREIRRLLREKANEG